MGLLTLTGGAQLMVWGAVRIARDLGVSDLVVGLTVVAVGTSLPELATSVLAALRGERDLAVGNVVGSNLFNLLAVLGAAGLASGNVAVSNTALRVDLPVMLLSTAILVPVFWNGFVISRLEGAILFTGYAGYLAYLVLDAAEHDATAIVELLALVVVPVVVVLFSVAGYRGWRRERRSGEPELLNR